MHLRSLLILSILLGSAPALFAQWGISLRNSVGLPFYMGKQGYYNTPAAGIGLHLQYRFSQSKVFPSATAMVYGMQLPVFSTLFNDLNVTATQKTVMLHLNYKAAEDNRGFIWYGGIGVAHIYPKLSNLQSNASAVSVKVIENGNNNYTYPAVDAGVRYMYYLKPRLYLGVDFQLRYIYLSGNDKLYLDAGKVQYPAHMSGNMLMPTINFSLQYIFEPRY